VYGFSPPVSRISRQTVRGIAEESGTKAKLVFFLRFSPNLLVDRKDARASTSCSGSAKLFELGVQANRRTEVDQRCVMITLDPATGEIESRNSEVRSFRRMGKARESMHGPHARRSRAGATLSA